MSIGVRKKTWRALSHWHRLTERVTVLQVLSCPCWWPVCATAHARKPEIHRAMKTTARLVRERVIAISGDFPPSGCRSTDDANKNGRGSMA